jgi:hypothetical protein
MEYTSLLASLAGTASATYLGYLYFRFSVHDRDCKQRALLTALEAGQPLPDTDIARATAVGFIGTLVPVVAFLAAVVGSWLVMNRPFMALQYVVLIVVWGVTGLVSLVTVKSSLSMLFRKQQTLEQRPKRPLESADRHDGPPNPETRFREPERIS